MNISRTLIPVLAGIIATAALCAACTVGTKQSSPTTAANSSEDSPASPEAVSDTGLHLGTAELVFNAVKGKKSKERPLTVTNPAKDPVIITSMTIIGDNAASFAVSAAPTTVRAGGSAAMTITFEPTVESPTGAQTARIRIQTEQQAAADLEVGLYGLATIGEQGNAEPTLQNVVDTLGFTVDVGGPDLLLGTDPAPIGDETAAQQFVKSGNGEVTMKPVARYSPDETLPFGWYPASSPGVPEQHVLTAIQQGQEQTLDPVVATDGSASFDPGTQPFGLFVNSKSFGRASFTQDNRNTNIPHAARTYPVRDRGGIPIANSYLVAFEDAQNGDYQDYVFELSNVQPVASSTAPVAKFDFTTTQARRAPGYTADTGGEFDATAGFGWVSPENGAPLDMSGQTRDRAGSGDVRTRTLILMQPTPDQSPTGPGSWEYALPNGTYEVTVGAGDPGAIDSVNRIQVEGVTVIDDFIPTDATKSQVGTVVVELADGELTIDSIGGTNTKLQFVDISRPTGE